MQKVIQVHEAIQIALRGAEQTGHLREAVILLGGVFLLGAGRKLNEQLFRQFYSFVMLKARWVIKLWWGDSTCGENN